MYYDHLHLQYRPLQPRPFPRGLRQEVAVDWHGGHQVIFWNSYNKCCKNLKKVYLCTVKKSQKGVISNKVKISKRCKEHCYEEKNLSATP